VFHCEACGLEVDRDLNAARNLSAWADPPDGSYREFPGK